ncbi:MAG: hypothetical protein ILO53_03745 [Clostridia bacterium]|nr:hypothetical protein [Clostridia bacterium]
MKNGNGYISKIEEAEKKEFVKSVMRLFREEKGFVREMRIRTEGKCIIFRQRNPLFERYYEAFREFNRQIDAAALEEVIGGCEESITGDVMAEAVGESEGGFSVRGERGFAGRSEAGFMGRSEAGFMGGGEGGLVGGCLSAVFCGAALSAIPAEINCAELIADRRSLFEKTIDDVLQDHMILPCFKGYRRVKAALAIILNARDSAHFCYKEMYRIIAERENVETETVEHSIRETVLSAWKKANRYCAPRKGSVYSLFSERPRTRELLCIMARKVRTAINNQGSRETAGAGATRVAQT